MPIAQFLSPVNWNLNISFFLFCNLILFFFLDNPPPPGADAHCVFRLVFFLECLFWSCIAHASLRPQYLALARRGEGGRGGEGGFASPAWPGEGAGHGPAVSLISSNSHRIFLLLLCGGKGNAAAPAHCPAVSLIPPTELEHLFCIFFLPFRKRFPKPVFFSSLTCNYFISNPIILFFYSCFFLTHSEIFSSTISPSTFTFLLFLAFPSFSSALEAFAKHSKIMLFSPTLCGCSVKEHWSPVLFCLTRPLFSSQEWLMGAE